MLCWKQVDKPRIEKKPVTSEHPVIRRKKKKYKDPDNLCKLNSFTLDSANSKIDTFLKIVNWVKLKNKKPSFLRACP